jgi:transglutaminase-like putative cysteine protease
LTLLQRHDFLAASRYVPHTWELAQFAQSRVAGAGDEDKARSLMAAIYETCEYVPGSTDISTTADAVLEGKRGVCQDFAHLLIALCRLLGLPARYVSGYLYDPDKPADAILASHAWAEVYLAGQGWLALDPTHNRATDETYIRVAIGRDYADATPVRGLFKGDAQETLDVRVHIRSG